MDRRHLIGALVLAALGAAAWYLARSGQLGATSTVDLIARERLAARGGPTTAGDVMRAYQQARAEGGWI